MKVIKILKKKGSSREKELIEENTKLQQEWKKELEKWQKERKAIQKESQKLKNSYELKINRLNKMIESLKEECILIFA